MATGSPISDSRASGLNDGTHRAVALRGVVLGTLGIAAAYGSAFGPPAIAAAGPWIMALALPVMMVSLMTLGAVRAGQPVGVLLLPFLMIIGLVAGSFLAALALPPDTADGTYWFGLPRRAAIVVYGVGLLPMFVLPFLYALTFEAHTLGDTDLAQLRARRKPRQGDPTLDATPDLSRDVSRSAPGSHA